MPVPGAKRPVLRVPVAQRKPLRVTIIEKDNLHEAGAPRRSVPQGQHAHGLLACGRDVMESLFCGVSDELVEKGALEVDYLRYMMWVSDGQPIRSGPSAIGGLLFSRPNLEEHIRSRLLKSKNVKLIAGASVTGLLRSADNKCVTGRDLRTCRRECIGNFGRSRHRCIGTRFAFAGVAARDGIRSPSRGKSQRRALPTQPVPFEGMRVISVESSVSSWLLLRQIGVAAPCLRKKGIAG